MNGMTVLVLFMIAFAVALFMQITGMGGRTPLFSTGLGVVFFIAVIVVIVVIIFALYKRNN